MTIILTADHHSVASASETQDICYPLFQYTEITAFVYARIFDNGQTYGLNTHEAWQLHHFNSGHLVTPPIPKNLSGNKISFILSEKNTPEIFMKTIQDFRQILGIDFPYFMIERYNTYYDLYVFCSSVDNKDIINFYLNEQKYIEQFKKYFKFKAKNLISDASKHKIQVPVNMQPDIDWNDKQKARPKFKTKQFIIHLNNRDIVFTAKEAECLKYLAIGYDTKGVADKMFISARTVEFHIKTIKSKMNLTSKTQVLTHLHRLEEQVSYW